MAHENGTQGQRPVLKPKKATPHYNHAAGVVSRVGNPTYVLLAKRPADGLLGGMWEFPNGRVSGDPAKELTKVLKTGYRLKVKRKEALGLVKHAYTHFKVTVHVFRCELIEISKDKNMKWVRARELEDYPMGKVDRQIAKKL